MRREYSADDQKPENPKWKANWLSVLTFWYTLSIFRLGEKHDITEDNLTKPLPEHKSSNLGKKISLLWSQEVDRAQALGRIPSVFRVIIRCFYKEYTLYGLALFLMEVVVRLTQPIFLGLLLRYFSPENAQIKLPEQSPMYLWRVFYYWAPNQCAIRTTEAYLYAGGVILCSCIVVWVMHPYTMAATHLGMKMRVACCSLIYRKALRINLQAVGGNTVGYLINLMSNDVNRFDPSLVLFHYLWLGPIQTLVTLYFMFREMKYSATIGISAILLVIPLQAYLGYLTAILRYATAACTDNRIKTMNEIIQGIQVIKMYAWEYTFSSLIKESREREIHILKYTSYIKGISMSFIMFTFRLSIFLTVVSYVLMGYSITTEKVFFITAYFSILRQSMTVNFPQAVTYFAAVAVAINRIQTFLLTEESKIGDPSPLHPNWKLRKTSNRDRATNQYNKPKLIVLENIWTKYGVDICLKNINLKVVPGRLTAIVGQVGAGKSSILNLVLGELLPFQGFIHVNGDISYSSPEPWLFAGSVKQNILFGQKYDRVRYKDVVEVCALARDFKLLPHGDETIIGERGVSLSGGQRARVNLARAVYKEADIYLLDDPLSAVDAQVGKHIFEQCIKKYLGNKVVILVTHQLQFLPLIEQILILEEGSILISGSYKHLQESGLDFLKFSEEPTLEDTPGGAKAQTIIRRISLSQPGDIETFVLEEAKKQEEVPEMRSLGAVGCSVYKEYFCAGGGCFVITMLALLFIGSQAVATGSDYCSSLWVRVASNDTKNEEANLPLSTYTYIYAGLIISTIIVPISRAFLFYNVCMQSSINLHDKMFYNIIRATMRFFNTNTSGRILNRFSKDLGTVDEFLPNAMLDTFQLILNLFGVVFVVIMVGYHLVIITIIISICFYILRQHYLRTSRSIKRLEGITKSPIFSHLNASLQGLTTIRSHGQELLLVEEFDKYQDTHSSAWFMFISTSGAFGYLLDSICTLYTTLVILSFLIWEKNTYGDQVGLVVTQCMGLSGVFQWGVRQSAELENQMTSVERVLEFTRIEQEPELESTHENKPPPEWPDEGEIEFRNAIMRYSTTEKPVIKNLTFLIQPKEKIGIVGRTGAGKSSLISAIFRLAYFSGHVYIDGIDISTIGLHDLRRKISIIPQEPIIFSGTMRYNLDPFNEYSDYALLRALQVMEIKSALTDGMECLDQMMSEGGANISVGERQLICLARAIIRDNIILVMDEATANVDLKTDQFIQRTLKTKFAHCTVLTIAHRLNTVMDSDRIIVMDEGNLVEFDHPHILLQNMSGYLSSMVDKTGPNIANHLRKVAQKSHKQKYGVSK